MGPKCKDIYFYKGNVQGNLTHTEDVKTDAEIRVMQPQDKKGLVISEPGISKEQLPSRASKGERTCRHLDFSPAKLIWDS